MILARILLWLGVCYSFWYIIEHPYKPTINKKELKVVQEDVKPLPNIIPVEKE